MLLNDLKRNTSKEQKNDNLVKAKDDENLSKDK